MEEFSKEFQNIISDAEKFQKIMEKNCSAGSYQDWKDKRKFIAEAIDGDGSVVDIGCAGGLFLWSLQEWTGHDLIPYGIDTDEELIKEAKKIFPKHKDNFTVMSVEDVDQLSRREFPKKFDFVYISIIDPTVPRWAQFTKEKLLPMTRKRIIFGFYGANKFPFGSTEWRKERKEIEQKVEKFKKSNFSVSGSLFNPTQFNQAIAWIDV